MGSGAGFKNITGSQNVFLGNAAGYNELGSNKLHIANNEETTLIYGDFSTGKVGIGGINTYATPDTFPATAGAVSLANYKLFVKGGILTEEVRINLMSAWADYVFAPEF